MRLGETKKVMSLQAAPDDTRQRTGTGRAGAKPRAGRADARRSSARKTSGTYYQAPFLAHLLAMKDQHPQTRERRRAEPDEALAAYRATVELTRFG